MRRPWLAALSLLAACSEAVHVTDTDGREHAPLQVATARAHLILFVSTDCPIANSYAPELRALAAEYEPRGIRLYVVHADRALAPARAREHATAYELPGTILLDPDHRLVRALGARTTPEAFVVTHDGAVYRGRIDDAWEDLGRRRRVVRTRDLRAALDELLAGRPVSVPVTEPVGCVISGT